MHRCKRTIRRLLEFITGELVDRLEVNYTKATALTIVGMAIITFFMEKLLPEA